MSDYNAILAAQVNLFLKRGDKATVVIYLEDPNNNNDPYDLSGFTQLTMHVKFRSESADIKQTLTLTGGELAVTGANNNGLQMNLLKTHTNMPAREYWYDVETNTTETILEGSYNVVEDVTKL